MTFDRVLVTCEHADHRVPARYVQCFRSARARAALRSHRGYDPGALGVARRIAERLRAPCYACTVTRLLVEVNRSLSHRDLFSEFTAGLDAADRQRLLDTYYTPHRDRVEAVVRREYAAGRRVLHLGVHSFTPSLRGVVRPIELGLLYDPARSIERRFCRRWQRELEARNPAWRIRRNQPYRGAADGFTTYLRRRFPARYAGVELEVNQQVLATRAGRTRLLATLGDSLAVLLARPG